MKLDFFMGGTYTQGRSLNVDASRCVNFFLELYPQGSKTLGALIGTPGLKLFEGVGPGPIRGMHFFNNLIWVVSGSSLYTISQTGAVSSALMTFSSSSGRVWMADNGLSPTGGDQLVIVDSIKLYYYNRLTAAHAEVSSWPSNIGIPQTVIYLGGYFIVTGNSGSFQVSSLYDASTWNSLDVAAKAVSPDALISAFNNYGQLWLNGSYTTEVWQQTAGTNPPFQWIQGAVMDYGSAAVNSIAKGATTIFWLANKRTGDAGEFVGAVMAQGYGVAEITPLAIRYKWQQYQTVSDAFGYCYADEGHDFYVITFPTANATWVYDASTSLWHERSSYSGSPYAVGRHLGDSYVASWGKHYVGDYRSQNVYQMSSNFYSDNGDPIVSFRTSTHTFDERGLNGRIISKLQIDAETGVGDLDYANATSYGLPIADGTYYANGFLPDGVSRTLLQFSGSVNPQAVLSWSDDGGHTWSNEYPASLGPMGKYKTRLIWRRLGYALNGRTYRIMISDPVKKVLISAYEEAGSGKA